MPEGWRVYKTAVDLSKRYEYVIIDAGGGTQGTARHWSLLTWFMCRSRPAKPILKRCQ